MHRQVFRLTRQELYEKMWSRPAIALAEDFGISGRGLGKLCSRFAIPVPPRGYWAKLAAGKRVTRIPLPTAKSDVPSEISIQASPETLAAALPEEVRSEVTAVLENREQILVPETLRSPLPIVKRWLEQKRERRKVDQLSGRRSEPPLDETERRKLRILSAIFTETEKLGHTVKETRGGAYFEIGAQRLDYRLFEPSKQVVIQLSDEERRRSWNPAIATRTDLQPTGELCFEISTWISELIRKRWRDGKRKKLKEQLGELVAGLIKAAAIEKELERVRAEKERQRQELERQRMEQERLRRIDAARWRHICELAMASRQAGIVRTFLDQLEERAKNTLGEKELLAGIRDWFSWARNRADAADPAFKPAAAIVTENSSLASGTIVIDEPASRFNAPSSLNSFDAEQI
jgi:hypothetical protein